MKELKFVVYVLDIKRGNIFTCAHSVYEGILGDIWEVECFKGTIDV